MIGYIAGKITLVSSDYCFVEAYGIGYRVFMSSSGISRLERGQETKLFTYTNVREDAILLFGFLNYEEYELFIKLISVSGVGPKVALGLLSATTPDVFRLAVINQDLKMLTKLPGVGKKTAERLLLELRDKLGFPGDAPAPVSMGVAVLPAGGGARDEAVQALLALGYDSSEIMPALKKLPDGDMAAAEIIKHVLKGFAGR